MGIPQHHSRDLPDRCFQLIEKLWPAVQEVYADGQEHLGPLTTTFLLALANPIIVLPIERIERHRGKEIGGYVNDRPLSAHLSEEVDRALGAARFDKSPFFEERQWRAASVPFDHQNFALHFPDDVREQLNSDKALETAASMPTSQWASVLRNAISHGGVSYLDGQGCSHDQGRTEMLAFVSATYPKYPKGHDLEGRSDTSLPPLRLNVLRVSEVDFRSFLTRWTEWLKSSGLSRQLAEAA
jgi:hypothetical protein